MPPAYPVEEHSQDLVDSFLLVLTIASTATVGAAAHCPANVESVPLRLVNRYQMIVSVKVNGSGPYDFLLDTGSKFTAVGRSLANELRLSSSGKAAAHSSGWPE